MMIRSCPAVVAVLIGCSLTAALATSQRIRVESHRDEKADFSVLRTYAWLPSPPIRRDTAPGAVTDQRISQEALGPHIVGAIDRELAARGLTRVDQGEADLQVVYFGAVALGMNTTDAGSYYQYTTGWALPIVAPSTASLEIVERGTITIDVVNRRTKTALWRGTIESDINHENQSDKRIARINEAISRVFERFPVRKLGKR